MLCCELEWNVEWGQPTSSQPPLGFVARTYSTHRPARLHVVTRSQHERNPVLIALGHVLAQITPRGSVSVAPPSLPPLDAQVGFDDRPVAPTARGRTAPGPPVVIQGLEKPSVCGGGGRACEGDRQPGENDAENVNLRGHYCVRLGFYELGQK